MKTTAVEWLYNHLFPKQLDGFSEEEWDKIYKAFKKAKAMEREQKEDVLIDIDIDLALIEDCAKGELGNSITDLRVKIAKLLNL